MSKSILSIVTVFALTVALSGCGSMSADVETQGSDMGYAAEPFPIHAINRAKFPADFAVTDVRYPSSAEEGTIIVKTAEKKLYLIGQGGKARRYAVAVGRTGYGWKGVATLQRKEAWPSWYPTDDMRGITPELPRQIAGGDTNPLGARALYLYSDGQDTLYRIHGTSEPWTIGTEASSGCIRMFNEDIIDVYARSKIGARVIVE